MVIRLKKEPLLLISFYKTYKNAKALHDEHGYKTLISSRLIFLLNASFFTKTTFAQLGCCYGGCTLWHSPFDREHDRKITHLKFPLIWAFRIHRTLKYLQVLIDLFCKINFSLHCIFVVNCLPVVGFLLWYSQTLIYLKKDSEAKGTFAEVRTFQSYENSQILDRKVQEIGKKSWLGDKTKRQIPSSIRNRTLPQREQPTRSCTSTKQQLRHAISLSSCIYWKTQIVQKTLIATCFRLLVEPDHFSNLAVFASTYVNMKKPVLSRQKEFVFTLESIANIFHKQAASDCNLDPQLGMCFSWLRDFDLCSDILWKECRAKIKFDSKCALFSKPF